MKCGATIPAEWEKHVDQEGNVSWFDLKSGTYHDTLPETAPCEGEIIELWWFEKMRQRRILDVTTGTWHGSGPEFVDTMSHIHYRCEFDHDQKAWLNELPDELRVAFELKLTVPASESE